MNETGKLSRHIHYLMAVVGGFLAAYALLNRGGLLGSAQTVNLIELLLAVLGKNLIEFITRLGALLLYIVGISSTVVIMEKVKSKILIYSILIDIITVLFLGILPEDLNNVVAIYPIAFAMAVQWTAFKAVDGYVSSCIFSSNNVKQMTISITEYFIDHDKSHLDRFGFFASVLLSFHAGAGISYFSYNAFGIKGAWICFVPLSIAFVLTTYKIRSKVYTKGHSIKALNLNRI